MSDAVTRLNAALEDRYRIERELGEGGMATVYLADDLKHERKVALKVLKPELAAVVGAERFLAEIKTTANLTHPHILPLHDSGEADSFLFYVMPHVEGESLRQRLDREHQLPVDDAVQIAKNVAEALDYAHSHGVIHRDIKPANILLQAGKPVISDFGIALAVSVGGGHRLTETGLSLGTPHYMSPEQAVGDAQVGTATDIYALGCVLYEMLVGEPPHTGSTPQAVLGKIITEPPAPVTKQRPAVPANVEATIQKALEKVPADRFRRTADIAAALVDPGFRGDGAVGVASEGFAGYWNRLSVAFAALSLLLFGALVVMAIRAPHSDHGPPFRVAIGLPSGQSLPRAARPAAISPDGDGIAYVAVSETGSLLHYLPHDQVQGIPLPGTNGARFPFFSPNGDWIGFFARNTLWKVRTTGGEVQSITVTGSSGINGATWSENDTIYFTRSTSEGVLKAPATGGSFETVSETGSVHWWPFALPGGRYLLVQLNRPSGTPQGAAIGILDTQTGEARVLIDRGLGPVYSPSGHVLYGLGDGRLMAAPFDLDRLDITGPSVPVARGLLDLVGTGVSAAVSTTGSLIYLTDAEPAPGSVVSVSRSGEERPIPGVDCSCADPSYSPDGRMLAVRGRAGEGRILLYDLNDRTSVPITVVGTTPMAPEWRPPDGSHVVFYGFGMNRVYIIPVDGSQPASDLMEPGVDTNAGSWTPDGRWYVFTQQFPELYEARVLRMDPTADTEAEVLTSGSVDYAPQVSPDGRWLAYQSRVSGRDEIWVRPYPDGGASVQVTSGGATSPLWSPDMGEIFYRVGSAVWSVEVDGSQGFRMGERGELFDGPYESSAFGAVYDVHPDGGSFVMTKLGTWEGGLVLVHDFFEELKRRVPN